MDARWWRIGGGAITSDAGALLLGATDRAIRLVDRFAACFSDGRTPGRVAHDVATLVGQRVFGIALGYEDLVDHDDLRRDPALGAALGRIEARGTVRNFVCGRAVKHQAIALANRSPKSTANWALAIAHSRGGMVHSFSARFKTRKSSFSAASSVGK